MPQCKPLRIFIGWDSKEPIAFEVFAHSILRRSSGPISIVPLVLGHLKGLYTRTRGPLEATEFSFSRFLIPYLCGYEGMALFADSDMLCQVDIYDILKEVEANPGKAVYCVKHDYTPKPDPKFLGQVQTRYEKKNWSSLMVMDTSQCRALTPDVVNTQTGLYLHRFQWLESEEQIAALDPGWNHLVGEYPPNPNAKILHFTLGAPCFPAYKRCDQADLWWAEYARMNTPIEDWISVDPGDVPRAAGYPYPVRSL